MANEKTWQFDMNRGYAASSLLDMARYQLWYLKAFLKGEIGGATQGLWTCVGSSNGVTGGMDNVDRWGATYTAGNLVRAAAGSPHSWIVLRSPAILGVNYYLMLDYSSSSDYTISWSLGADTSVPTGGTYQTAPAWPATPVAPGINTSANFSMSTNFGAMKVHGALATDGSFHLLASRDNTGQFFSVWMFQLLANYKVADQFPCWMMLAADTTVTNGVGRTSTTGPDASTLATARAPDNSRDVTSPGAIIPVTTYMPNGPDSYDGSYVDWPLWVGSKDAATRCIKGRLADVMYFGGGANTGAVDNPAGAPSYMIVNNFWYPTNVAPQL